MNRAAIFGCGLAGKSAYMRLRSRHRIVCFLDNNRKLHHSRVLGIPVHKPETYDYSTIDRVFIASMYCDEILVQLLSLGVPSSKIEYIDADVRIRETTSSFWANLPTCLRQAVYLPFRILR